jgi:hypothetical protein
MITLCTAQGEQHGAINTITNAVQFDDFKNMTPEHKAQCQKQKKEDARIVKAKLIAKNGSQERLVKPYCAWAGDPIVQYSFIPGYTYDVPKGLVDEVNGKKKIKRADLVQVDGKNVQHGGAPTARDQEEDGDFMFVPVNW